MNGLRPPLTAPPGFAVRQSRSDSKECCRPALLFREGEFPWQTRKPIKNISSAGTTPLARLLSAVPDSVRPCRNYVELHIILLYFPAFCDTILILINFTAENSRWNINIFAKVFPAKSPQIHPTISEFAESECFRGILWLLLSLRPNRRRVLLYGWEFLFFGTSIDAVETTRHSGIGADRVVNYYCGSARTARPWGLAWSHLHCSSQCAAGCRLKKTIDWCVLSKAQSINTALPDTRFFYLCWKLSA